MWSLYVKDKNGLYQMLDVPTEDLYLCFEAFNADNISSKFIDGSYDFVLPKTPNNNRLLAYIISTQSYNIYKTYIDCVLTVDGDYPLGPKCSLQIQSQDREGYRCVVLAYPKLTLDLLGKIGCNENNTSDTDYYNALGFYSINTEADGQMTYINNPICKDIPFFDVDSEEVGEGVSDMKGKLIGYDETKTFTNPVNGDTYDLQTSRYPLFDLKTIWDTTFNLFGISADYPSDYNQFIAPQYRTHYPMPFYKNCWNGTTHTTNSSTYYGQQLRDKFVTTITENLGTNKDYWDVRDHHFDSPCFIIQIESELDSDGNEIPILKVGDNDSLFDWSVSDFGKKDLFQFGIGSGAVFTSLASSANAFYDLGMMSALINYMIGGAAFTTLEGLSNTAGNYDNWFYDPTYKTHRIQFAITLGGNVYASNPKCYHSFDCIYNNTNYDGQHNATFLYLKVGTVITLIQQVNKTDTTTGKDTEIMLLTRAKHNSVKQFKFDKLLFPDVIRSGYKDDWEGDLTGGIGDYTDNSVISIQDSIGHSTIYELFKSWLQVSGGFYNFTGTHTVRFLNNTEKLDTPLEAQIDKLDYQLDDQYNDKSVVSFVALNTLYSNKAPGTSWLSYQNSGVIKELTNTTKLDYINNPVAADSLVEESVFDSNFNNPTSCSTVNQDGRFRWDGYYDVPVIPWTLNDGDLGSDSYIVFGTWGLYNRYWPLEKIDWGLRGDLFHSIYTNYCKVSFTSKISNPQDLLFKSVYLSDLNVYVLITKIDKYKDSLSTCSIEGLVLS